MMRLFLASPPRNEASRAFARSKQRTPTALNEGLSGQPGDLGVYIFRQAHPLISEEPLSNNNPPD